MKRVIMKFGIGLFMVASLAGCGYQSVEENMQNVVEQTMTGRMSISPEDFLEEKEIVYNLPKEAEGSIRIMINNEIVEQPFVIKDSSIKYTFRIAATTELTDISWVKQECNMEEDCIIGDFPGKVKLYAKEGTMIKVCFWFDAAKGVTYSLKAEDQELEGLDIQEMAQAIME